MSVRTRWLAGALGAAATAFALPAAALNLITDGDFEAFDPAHPDFISVYHLPTPAERSVWAPQTILWDEGDYDVSRNPNSDHVYFASFGDHTSGAGNMMVVNGDSTANAVIWSQAGIPVIQGSTYTFTFSMASVDLPRPGWAAADQPVLSPGQLNLTMLTAGGSVADTVTSSPFTASILQSDVGRWVTYSVDWTATSSVVQLALWNANLAKFGNDFALDDLSFSLKPPASSPPPSGPPPSGPPAGEPPPVGGGTPSPSPVPEPAAWLTLLLGFAVLGQTLRHRPGPARS